MKQSDRCIDCSHCHVWSTDRNKASCDASWSPRHYSQGFDPYTKVPRECIEVATRG